VLVLVTLKIDSAKMYGLRRSKRKTEEIIKLLEENSKNAKKI